MSRTSLTTIIASLLFLEVPIMAATLRNARIELSAEAGPRGVIITLTDRKTGQLYADRPYHYSLRPEGATDAWSGLSDARVETDERKLIVKGRLTDSPVKLRQVWTVPKKGDWIEERLTLTNTRDELIAVGDLSFGLRRSFDALGDFRFVAVPYRRQCDGKLYDFAMDDVREGRFSNSDWHNDATVAGQDVCDAGKLRSEGWSITDGERGLLVIKYNPDHIEYSLAFPDGDELQLGGAGLALYREPRPATSLQPGKSFAFGITRYHAHDGGWREAYRIFRDFMDAHGHGLTPDYDPPVNWNELFDVGWYHSDRKALFEHYTRDALLYEAEKAKDVGAELLYLDPGWGVCEGTTLWDRERLGEVQALADELRERFGLGLGYRTIGRVYRDEFPNRWYIRRNGREGPYERPMLSPPVKAEPAPLRDERGCRNLALLPGASVTASSVIPGYPELHTIKHVFDGWYNNPASWISAGEPSWVELDLGGVFTIDTVALGSEHTAHYRDRAVTAFNIEVTPDAPWVGRPIEWSKVVEYEGEAVRDTRAFRFEPLKARRVRVNILRTDAGDQARIDELEVYEASPGAEGGEPRRGPEPKAAKGHPLGFWEVCTQSREWQEEKLKRILDITRHGVTFMMFDEFDWRGPCYDPTHGHPVPSTPEGHVRAIYGLIEAMKRECPGVLVEAHDPVWPWAMRYTPTYFGQRLTAMGGQSTFSANGAEKGTVPTGYDENWGFEFMWNPIEDLRSGRALCLYYYNLAYDIPLYDHITMEGDNDNALAFWWYASTVRHLGIGGKKGLHSPEENETRYAAYKRAMATYMRLKPWFVRGAFIGIDELTHLHALAGRPGGVIVAFNLGDEPVEREALVSWDDLETDAEEGKRLRVEGAAGTEATEEGLRVRFEVKGEGAVVVGIGEAAEDMTTAHGQ